MMANLGWAWSQWHLQMNQLINNQSWMALALTVMPKLSYTDVFVL